MRRIHFDSMKTPSSVTFLTSLSACAGFLLLGVAASGHVGGTKSGCTCDVVELERVVVTARPSERPLSVTVDPRAAAQPMPAQDGAEALRGVAGISIIRKGGTDGDPVLRGMAGSRLGILVDGENILGGCSNRMDPPTAYVFPTAYDRITVLKGPQSVLYGPGNSAGVVLFERAPQRFEQPATKVAAALTLGAFGRNDQFLEVRSGRPVGYAEVAATRAQSDDYEDGDGRAIASAYTRWSARAAAGWTPDARTLVEISSTFSDGEAAYADRSMDGVGFARSNLSLRGRRTAVSPLVDSLEASIFVNEVDHVMDNYSLRPFTPTAMMPGRAAANPDRRTIGGRALAKLLPGSGLWRIVLGTDYQENRHRSRSTSNEEIDPYERKPRLQDAEFVTTGLLGEATRQFGASRRVVAGARLDFWRAQDYRSHVATGMMGSAVNPTAGQTRSTDLPSAFARYEHDFSPGATWFAGVGHAERFPDYWELFSKESAASVSAFQTRPERTTQADLGINFRGETLSGSVSLFVNRVDDFILIQTGVTKPAGMMGTRSTTITRNIDSEACGGEASIAWKFAGGWTLDGAMSAVRGANRTDRLPLAQQPPLEGRLGLGYATTRWSVGSVVRMAAAQDRFAVNQGNIAGQDLGPSPGFTTLSLNGAWKPIAQLQVSVGVDNLGDRTYAEHLSRGGAMVAGFPAPTLRINEPGRTWWTKIDFKW